MTLEEEVEAILEADDELVALATGGIYADQFVGVEGFHRGEHSKTADAFDENGELKPCILIREGAEVPYGNVRNPMQGYMAVAQGFSLYFFQMRDRDQIDLMKDRTFQLLEGVRVGRSYPVWKVGQTSPVPDSGPLLNSTSFRQDWMRVRMLVTS